MRSIRKMIRVREDLEKEGEEILKEYFEKARLRTMEIEARAFQEALHKQLDLSKVDFRIVASEQGGRMRFTGQFVDRMPEPQED